MCFLEQQRMNIYVNIKLSYDLHVALYVAPNCRVLLVFFY